MNIPGKVYVHTFLPAGVAFVYLFKTFLMIIQFSSATCSSYPCTCVFWGPAPFLRP